MKKLTILFFILFLVVIFIRPVEDKQPVTETKSQLRTSLASRQVYYTNKILAHWGWGFVTPLGSGGRVKVVLDETSRTEFTTGDQYDKKLWWEINNQSSATIFREETKTVSYGAEYSGKIGMEYKFVSAEIGTKFSFDSSTTISFNITVPPYKHFQVYEYKVRTQESNLKEQARQQVRVWWSWYNVGNTSTSHDVVRVYQGAGHTISEVKDK